MILPAAELRLQAGARSELRLRSGDFVSVQVIKRLTADKWAVAIRGRVLPARSGLQLWPGQSLQARVLLEGRQVLLRLSEAAENPVRELLLRAGLPADTRSEAVAAALLRGGLSATAQNITQVRELLERLRLDPRRFARLVSLLLEKGIDVRSSGAARLLAVLGHGQGQPEADSRRFRGRRSGGRAPELAEALQGVVQEQGGGSPSGLPVFNHLRGREGTWVLVPFSLQIGDEERIDGSIRLLYEQEAGETRRAVVTARLQRGGQAGARWSFHYDGRGGQPRLACYCDAEAAIDEARAALPALKRKLGNLGVKADDTIRKDDAFDGFSPPGEDVTCRRVDAAGQERLV